MKCKICNHPEELHHPVAGCMELIYGTHCTCNKFVPSEELPVQVAEVPVHNPSSFFSYILSE